MLIKPWHSDGAKDKIYELSNTTPVPTQHHRTDEHHKRLDRDGHGSLGQKDDHLCRKPCEYCKHEGKRVLIHFGIFINKTPLYF